MRVHERYLDQMLKKSNSGDSLNVNPKKAQFPIREQAPQVKMNKKMKPTVRRKSSFSPVAIVFTFFGLGVAFYGYENIESLEKWLNSVQFSFMTSSIAEEKPKEAKAASSAPAQAAVKETKEEKAPEAPGIDFDFVKDFKDRKKALDQKEEELKTWEAEIQSQKSELDSKISEIQKIRTEISAQLEERVKADQAKIETLVQVYSQMKAAQAAKVFEALDEDLAVDILTKMKKKNAADILNLLKADKAQVLSERFAGYSRKPAQAKSDSKQETKTEAKHEGEPVNATKP